VRTLAIGIHIANYNLYSRAVYVFVQCQAARAASSDPLVAELDEPTFTGDSICSLKRQLQMRST